MTVSIVTMLLDFDRLINSTILGKLTETKEKPFGFPRQRKNYVIFRLFRDNIPKTHFFQFLTTTFCLRLHPGKVADLPNSLHGKPLCDYHPQQTVRVRSHLAGQV